MTRRCVSEPHLLFRSLTTPSIFESPTHCPRPLCPFFALSSPFVSPLSLPPPCRPLFSAQAETEARESAGGVDPMSAERYDDEFGVRNSLLPGLRTSQTLPEHTRDALEFNAVPNDYDGAFVVVCRLC